MEVVFCACSFMYRHRPCEKSAGSIPDSVQPPTPSATPKATDCDVGFSFWVFGEGSGPTLAMKKASWPLFGRCDLEGDVKRERGERGLKWYVSSLGSKR